MRATAFLSALAVSACLVVSAPAQTSCTGAALSTPFTANSGQYGNMFDIVNIDPDPNGVLIDAFECDLDIGVWDMEVYTKTGTFVGFEGMSSAWALVGCTSGVIGNGMGVPTPLPLSINTNIPFGSTQAFYVTASNGQGMNYTVGNQTVNPVGGVLVADASLQILNGSGNEYPFGASFEPRLWNGTVCYTVGAPSVVVMDEYQRDSDIATANIDGEAACGPQQKTVVNRSISSCGPFVPITGTYNVSTTGNPGAHYETVFSDTNLLPASVSIVIFGGTEILNLNVLSNLSYMNGGASMLLKPMPFNGFPGSSGHVSLSASFSIGVSTDISMQTVITASSSPIGFAFSQGTELHVDTPPVPTSVPGPTGAGLNGDDEFTVVSLVSAPSCWLAPGSGITFYGTVYDELTVSANGRVAFGPGNTDWTATPAEFVVDSPSVGVWTDFTPAPNAISVSFVNGTNIRVDYTNIVYYGQPGPGNYFGIEFDRVSNTVSIDGLTGLNAGPAENMLIGISSGLIGGSTAAGATVFSAGGSGSVVAPTDAWYDFWDVLAPPPGPLLPLSLQATTLSTIDFVPFGTNYDWFGF